MAVALGGGGRDHPRRLAGKSSGLFLGGLTAVVTELARGVSGWWKGESVKHTRGAFSDTLSGWVIRFYDILRLSDSLWRFRMASGGLRPNVIAINFAGVDWIIPVRLTSCCCCCRYNECPICER